MKTSKNTSNLLEEQKRKIKAFYYKFFNIKVDLSKNSHQPVKCVTKAEILQAYQEKFGEDSMYEFLLKTKMKGRPDIKATILSLLMG